MIIVYSLPNCPYCVKAKEWLKAAGFAFEEVDMVANPDAREKMRNAGHRTAPQLYYGDRLMVSGGYEGLSRLSPGDVKARIDMIEAERQA